MKIAIICDILGKKNNGTSIASYNLINFMKAKGHNVTVVCCDCDENEDKSDFVLLDKMNLGLLNKIIDRNGVSFPSRDREKIAKAIADCDIVHIMMPFPVGIAACKIAKDLGKPITAGFHCQAELVSSHFGLMKIGLINRLIYKTFYNKLYKHCDAVHYPTQFIREVFESAVGKTKGQVISNGVNDFIKPAKCNKPKDMKEKFVILSTGRLCKEKSHKVLIDAVAKSRHSRQIQVIIAGQGPLLGKLKKRSDKKLSNPTIFNYFTREEMLEILNWADLYCHPAQAELEGIACLEAVACGLVPVVSDSQKSATKNFALKQNNLFQCNNADDLAEKIDYWIEHPRKKADAKKKYIEFGKSFNQSDCMDKMEKMFLSAITDKNLTTK